MAAAKRAVQRTLPCLTRFACLAVLSFAGPARAQPYAAFDVPDSLIVESLRGASARFESAWNALLVDEMRAAGMRADAAAHLRALAVRVAGHEPEALGTHIARDALKLRDRWARDQRRLRVRAAVRESLAAAAQASREYEAADSLFNLALADYRRLGEERRTAWVLGSIGQVAFQAGDYARADSVYGLALAARRALGDPRLIGNTLNSFGVLHYLADQPTDARRWFEEARAVRERTGERGPLGATLNYLGLVQSQLDHADSARMCFDRALEITVAAGDSTRTADVLVNTVGLLTDAGDHREAVRLGERAALIYRETGNARGEARLQASLGNLLRQQGRFAESLESFQRSVELSRDARDVRGLLQTWLSMGQLAVTLGDPGIGVPPSRDALRLADSLEDVRSRAAALNNLALLAERDGDLAAAEQHARSALESARQAEDAALEHDAASSLGGLALERRDLAEARRWYEHAAGLGGGETDERRASDLNNLGIVAVLEDSLAKAERLFREALTLATGANAPDFQWPPLLGLGEVAERRGDFPGALAFDREAATRIDTLRALQGEEARSIVVLSERRLAVEALIHLLTRLQSRFPDSAYVAEAFVWSERARARALVDLLAASGRHVGPVPLVDPGGVRAALPSGRTAFLEYSLGDSSSSLWVITRKRTHHITLPPRGQLRARIETLRRALALPATAESPTAVRAARSLYKTLLEPAQGFLERIDHLVISPDGPLALVPFEALLVRDVEARGTPAPEDYVIHRYTISYVPSASVLALLRGRAPGTEVVALGDPSFGDQGPALTPLPHTAEELDVIANAAGHRQVRLLRGSGATRPALLGLPELGHAAIVHLATHGTASEFEPRRAGLWLAAGDDGTSGFLSLSDVLGLSLDADLVTLSACETGVGRVARGEGVLGLPRALLAAGARSVLVSLWKVSDRSAAALMSTFYRELLVHGRPAHEALVRAKREMLASAATRSPYHWAPFVLTGRYPERR